MTPTPLALNARFRQRPTTGVERYATEIASRLPAATGRPLVELAPAGRGSGARGHAWEQLVLPGRFRRSGAELLLSLCNVGPVGVARQIVVVHDVAPFLLPDSFSPAYRAQVRWIQRLLVRRCTVVTVSEHSRSDIARTLGMAAETISLVPPAVGEPFLSAAAAPRSASDYCVFVGAHDDRKNLRFLLDLWPSIHASTGLFLDVAGRSESDTLKGADGRQVAGVRHRVDLPDDALCELYRGALALLSPSRYEGFGLPLLEAMACGTPFLSTDTGAARELAVRPDQQLLPLDAAAWVARIQSWADEDLGALRRGSTEVALRRTWESSTLAMAEVIDRASRSVGNPDRR